MGPVVVLGNGISRKGLNLNKLREFAPIYGCNALYREHVPDVLVATDTAISETIQQSNYALKNKFYTRKPIPGLGAFTIPEPYWKYSSGLAAIGIAAENNYDTIFLIGFDMGPSEDGKFNNVYADTEFYKKSTDVPTYTGNWVNQLISIVKSFPTIKFVRLTGDTTACIPALNNISNLSHCPICEFWKTYK